MLSSEVSIFFCKFDDALYMKLAKLDVILTLANNQNVGRVLDELFDYAQQTDVEFVRKRIRSLGKVAVAFESAADACVDKLVSLIDTKGPYVVQECIIVAVDIFRRYPGKYEGIVSNISARLSGNLDDHRAKAAMVWILGEYSDSIANSGDLISSLFLDEFADETADVQLAILTAVVKYYLINDDGDDMLRRVIGLATNQIDNPDVRDRAFIYYALVAEGGDATSQIVLPEHAELPQLSVDFSSVNPQLVDSLVPEIGTLSVLYERLPEEFVETIRFITIDMGNDDAADINKDLGKGESTLEQMTLPVLVESSQGSGIEIRGILMRVGNDNSFVLRFRNYSEQPAEMQQIAFNKNIFGFAPGELKSLPIVGPQGSVTINVPVVYSEAHLEGAVPSLEIQIAILIAGKNPIFFSARASLELILAPGDAGGKLTREEFMKNWQEIDEEREITVEVPNPTIDAISVARLRMQERRLFFAAKRENTAYFTGKTIKGEIVLVFISYDDDNCVVGVRMWNKGVGKVIRDLVAQAVK
jgi:hypothetical protein